MRTRVLMLGLLVLMVLGTATTSFAQGPVGDGDGGRFFRDEDVSLKPGDTFDGDLGVLNGDLDVPEGSTVNGDVFVTDGDATIGGRIDGDVAVVGGHLEMAEQARVSGDVFATGGNHDVGGQVRGNLSVLFGDLILRSTSIVEGDLLVAPGAVEREEGAQIRGNEVHDLRIPDLAFLKGLPANLPLGIPFPETDVPRVAPSAPPWPSTSGRDSFGHWVARYMGRFFGAMFLGVLLVAIGVLIAAVWTRPTRRVADCIGVMPLQSFGLGLLTLLLAVGLEVVAVMVTIVIIVFGALLIGTVILIPVGLLLILLSWLVLLPVPLGLVGGMLLGWVGLAQLIGQKVLKALHGRESTPVGATLTGLLLMGAVAGCLWVVQPACCAWPFVILLISAGLGAVLHTRFGTRCCRSNAGTAGSSVIRPEHPVTDANLPSLAEALPVEAMDQESGAPDSAPTGT